MSGLIGIVLEANVLGLFDIFHKKETEEVFSDASTIPENEKNIISLMNITHPLLILVQ